MPAAPRYLVGVDFSTRSRRALALARELAAASGARLTIAHVRPFSDVRAAVTLERSELLRLSGRKLASEIEAAYQELLTGLAREDEDTRLLRGASEVAICREAQRGYKLVVLGSRGRRGLTPLILGSTALRVLGCSTVPVVVVPAGKG